LNPNKTTPNEQLWQDVLATHYHHKQGNKVLQKYNDKYTVCRLTISSYEILDRFKNINRGQPYSRQIKPFNFILVGVSHQQDPKTKRDIIPMHPYINRKELDTEKLARTHFIDYKTGTEYMNLIDEGQLWTTEYWKPLRLVVKDYMEHAESKFNPDKQAKGKLPRRHVVIDDDSIRYIGKETNDLGESETIGVNEENYTEYIDDGKIEWKEVLDSLTPDKAAMAGISPRNLRYLKQRINRASR
jgi:hypothetical protein